MDNWVLISVTTICHVTSTTIMTQNVSKKKKNDTEHLHHPRKFPPAPCSHTPHPSPRQPLIGSLLQHLTLSFPEFYKNEIVQHTFVFLPSPLSAILGDSSCCCTTGCLSFFIVVKYGHTPVCLFTYWWIFGSFTVWGFSELRCCEDLCASVSGHMLSFLLGKYLEVEFSCCMVDACLTG